MNLRTRRARLSTAFVLALNFPGLAPDQAAAQSFSARALPGVSAVSAVGAAGASARAAIPVLGAPISALPGSVLLSAPSAVPTSAPAGAVLATPAVAAAIAPVSAASVSRTAASVSRTAASVSRTAATAPAAEPLRAAASRVAASADADPSGAAARVQLDALFTGETSRPATDLSVAAAPTSGRALLSRPAAADGPRWVFTDQAPKPAAPRTSLKRTLSVGFLAGAFGVIFTDLSMLVAKILGWTYHGNYQSAVTSAEPTAAAAAVLLVAGSVMAPIAEEIVFRAGLQGGLSKLAAKLRLGTFLLPALVTSLAFVAVHETADPVFFAIRFGFAAALSYVFKKEGILASMTAHSVFNGLQMLPILFAAVNAPWLVLPMLLGAWGAGIISWRLLGSQKPDIASGELVPKPFTAKHALMFLPILAFGYLFLTPNLFWLAGGAGLAGYLLVKAVAALWRGVRSLIR